MLEQSVLDLLPQGNLSQNLIQRRINEVVEGREHTHQIGIRLGDGHILGVVHEAAAEASTHEGEA